MAKSKGVEVQLGFAIREGGWPNINSEWETVEWMSGASAQELRTAIANTRARYPGKPVRVLKNGKVAPLPKGA